MSTDASPPSPPSSRFNLYLNLSLIAFAIVAVIAWRRAQDPTRRWAKRVETEHANQVERPLTRCFGTSDPAAIRRLADALHRGPLPAPLRDCHRGPAAELLVSPNAFTEFLLNPPQPVTALRDRLRNGLFRLSGTYRMLEQGLAEARGTPDEAQRERLAQRIEALAAELADERRALQDLVTAARDAAPLL